MTIFICFIIVFYAQADHVLDFLPENKVEYTSTIFSDTIIGGYLPYYKINKVTPDIFDYLTHLYYFSLGPNSSGDLGRVNGAGQFTPVISIPSVQENIDTLLSWRDSKLVKIYLVVGGWVQSDYFDEAVANPISRANLITNIKNFCLNNGLDGVDLDWEPYHGHVNDTHYGLLISELRVAFNKTNLEISSAINPTHTSLIEAYSDADFIQLMTYGKHFDGNTQVSMVTLENWVNGWINSGFSKSKLVIGLPAYGKTPADNTAIMYGDVVNLYDPQPDIDMIIHDSKTYYFNGINTIKQKTQYMLDNNLKGVMMWELGQDITVTDPKSLLRSIYETIYNSGGVTIVETITTNNSLKLYPNPVQNKVNVEFELNEPANISFTVSNIYGQTVWYYKDFFKIGKQRISINIKEYLDGFYILNYNNGKNTCQIKFIKM